MEFVDTVGYTYAKEACFVCLAANNLIDMGAYIEGEGALAICLNCAKEAARVSGADLADPAKDQELEDLRAELAMTETLLDEARWQIDAAVDARTVAEAKFDEWMSALAEGIDKLGPRAPASQMFTKAAPRKKPAGKPTT